MDVTVKRQGKAERDSDVLKSPALYYLVLEVLEVRLFYSSSKECIYTKAFMSGADFTEDFVGKMEKEI